MPDHDVIHGGPAEEDDGVYDAVSLLLAAFETPIESMCQFGVSFFYALKASRRNTLKFLTLHYIFRMILSNAQEEGSGLPLFMQTQEFSFVNRIDPSVLNQPGSPAAINTREGACNLAHRIRKAQGFDEAVRCSFVSFFQRESQRRVH